MQAVESDFFLNTPYGTVGSVKQHKQRHTHDNIRTIHIRTHGLCVVDMQVEESHSSVLSLMARGQVEESHSSVLSLMARGQV
jgi:hypothetical protein